MERRDVLIRAAHETEMRPIRYSKVKFTDYEPPKAEGIPLAPKVATISFSK
jgi:hypothetical protein